ncbi:MAG: Cytochrome c biogenesis protein CcdA [Chloroflexi bacterium]|jgi:cytochrome c biogenesis protein CcdA|nr:MAG: Cytochrome c biogenesis protein CcdA [Chloroflexota bacterium]
MTDIPVLYAFSAGMLATINPCGFVMLPAFIAYQIGLADTSRGVATRLVNSITVSLLVSAGFITLFGIIGFIISIGGAFIISAFPWFGLAAGVALSSLGLYSMFAKKKIGFMRTSRLQGPREVRSVREYYLFGISYGLASLSCTLPIFLVVVASAITIKGAIPGLIQFISYGLGMGFIFAGITISTVFFKTATANKLRPVMRHLNLIGSVALTAAGLYLVHYWTFGVGAKVLFN